MSIIQEAFDKYARTAKRGFSARARESTVGASEIGLCARKVWYGKNRTEHDHGYIEGWGAAKRGTTFEAKFFVPAMRKHYGDHLIFSGAQQKRLVDKFLAATPDGLLVNLKRDFLAGLMVPNIGPSNCVGIECKTIDPRINLSEPKGEHVFQVQVQLGLLRKLTKYKPQFAVLIYTNASFFDDTVEFVVEFDPAVFEEAERRARQIMQATDAAELKPEGWIDGGTECGYCPYAKACRAIRGNVPDTDKVAHDPQFIAEMIDLANQERKAHSVVDAASVAHRELQEKIKSRLREKSLRFVKTPDLNIVWSAVKGRPSFDMPGIKAAAAAAGVNLQGFETTGQPSDRLLVSVTKRDRLVK
jgi:CRISPR/Cas system-associated exonuclease Cas4 (RecB family)